MTVGGNDLLHDPAGLLAADVAGLLPAAATAGAQVRAIRSALADLSDLDRPRALVVVGPAVAAETALLRAVVGDRAAAPIVDVQEISSWVGALDIVVVLAGQVHDPLADAAAESAARRGATVIVRAAAGTPSPGSGTVLVTPRVAVPEALATPARLALLLGVAHRAGLLPAAPDLAGWADVLDSTALACHPSAEEFVNPAVALAEQLAAGAPLLVGADPIGDAVAAIGAGLFADLAGIPAAVLPSATAAQSPSVLRRAAGPRDLFADPFADPADGPLTIASVIVSVRPDSDAAAALAAALPGAPVLAPDRDRPAVGAGPGRLEPDRRLEPAADRLGVDVACAATDLVLRLTFSAVYLGLTAGQLPPLDAPDGLGRAGTALGAVRVEERGAFAPVRDLDAGGDADDRELDDDFLRSIGGLTGDRRRPEDRREPEQNSE
jgi:hypothetical protein